MKRLYSVTKPDGVRVFCGPFALMVITGKTFEQATRSINRVLGKHHKSSVRGVYPSVLVAAIEKSGKKVHAHYPSSRPTLGKWMDSRGSNQMKSIYLVSMSTHFGVVQGNRYIDNHTTVPVRCDESPFRQRKVRGVYEVK